jgi:WXG100 family type VII secretion target
MQVGGDPEQLSALKASFETQAGRVQELTATLRGNLANTSWQGASAERFRTAWEEYERVLGRLEQALLDAGAEVGQARDRLIQL